MRALSRCADRAHRWVVARGSNVCASDGSKRVIGALFDISERKAAEAELARVLRDKEALLAQKDTCVRNCRTRTSAFSSLLEHMSISVGKRKQRTK